MSISRYYNTTETWAKSPRDTFRRACPGLGWCCTYRCTLAITLLWLSAKAIARILLSSPLCSSAQGKVRVLADDTAAVRPSRSDPGVFVEASSLTRGSAVRPHGAYCSGRLAKRLPSVPLGSRAHVGRAQADRCRVPEPGHQTYEPGRTGRLPGQELAKRSLAPAQPGRYTRPKGCTGGRHGRGWLLPGF